MMTQVALLLFAAWLLTSAVMLAGYVVYRIRSTLTFRVRVRVVEIKGEEFFEASTDAAGGTKWVAKTWRRAVGGVLGTLAMKAEEL
jgi:hypothetical protein